MCTTCTFYQLKVQGGMPLFIEIQNIKFQISYYYYYYYIEQLLSSHPHILYPLYTSSQQHLCPSTRTAVGQTQYHKTHHPPSLSTRVHQQCSDRVAMFQLLEG
jgi:uncharacterized CHY-type Zn-finger protein